MINNPQPYENKFLALLEQYPKYTVLNVGLPPEDINDDLIREVWEKLRGSVTENTEQYQALNMLSDLLIESGIADNKFRYGELVEGDLAPEAVAKKISELAYQRRVYYRAQEIVKNITDTDKLSLLVDDLSQERLQTDGGMIESKDIAAEFEAKVKAGNMALPWAIPKMDKALGGKEKGTLIVLGGRSGMGKTSLALQAARVDAMAGHRVGLFELEMSRLSVWGRIACGMMGIDYKDVIGGHITESQKEELIRISYEEAERYKDSLFIEDTGGLTYSDIWQKTISNNLDVIYIDHLQIMSEGGTGTEKRYEALGKITMQLKNLAKARGIPVVCLVQLNTKSVDARKDKRPQLKDLRESGDIEQNADDILLMYRPGYYDEMAGSETEIIVGKFRNGQPCVVNLEFDKKRQWFTAPGEPPDEPDTYPDYTV